MAYTHDVFISYRRHAMWTPWVRDKVKPLLDGYMTQELGRQVDIFVDERIDPGVDWPHALGTSLASSRVMFAIFSGDYFGSEWCLHELDLMHQRQQCYPGTAVIIPVIGHDGELIPVEIAKLQPVDMKEFRNPDIQPHTPRSERFADAMLKLAPRIRAAIVGAPPYDPIWTSACCARFSDIYAASNSGRTVDLQTITRKPLPSPALPRVSP
jgi:hypothetical protein